MDEFKTQLDRHIRNVGHTPMLMFYLVENDPCPFKNKQEYFEDTLSHYNTVNEYDPMQFHGVKSQEELSERARAYTDATWEKVSDPVPLKAMKGIIDPRNPDRGREEIESLPNFVRWYDLSRQNA